MELSEFNDYLNELLLNFQKEIWRLVDCLHISMLIYKI